jgi:hypothetical protein
MDKYWAPDLVAKAYFRGKSGDSPMVHDSRKKFQDSLMANHEHYQDSMEIRDLIIDELNKKAVVLSKITKIDPDSGETCEINGMGCYKLAIDNQKSITIKSIDFFWDAPEKIKKISL